MYVYDDARIYFKQRAHLYIIVTQLTCNWLLRQSCNECLVHEVCNFFNKTNKHSRSEIREYALNIYLHFYDGSEIFEELL